uniref:FYVE-type domain-containing protein n=1 Tax=Globisporangium ultimum (strain ATCC 200006 / CBS 805.95 / DAOM BR144) TaxID=431595 RepID=K3W727_GLOUD
MTSGDHIVFTRLSRQQLIVRRRSLGVQVLTYTPSTTPPCRCKHCGRFFNSVWKEYLCHVCGLWVCQPCSSVIERERQICRVRFVRACVHCMSIVNKWSDPELLTELVLMPWVLQSSKSQLALHLADVLRSATTKSARRAVLKLLVYFGRPVHRIDPDRLDQIHDDEWSATNSCTAADHDHLNSSHFLLDGIGQQNKAAARATVVTQQLLGDNAVVAHFLVQQCFEVVIPELRVEECVFAESEGTREYPIYYDEATESPTVAPTIATEEARTQWIRYLNLAAHNVNTNDMELICELAAKELDALTAFISIIQGDQQLSVACRPGSTVGACGVYTWRPQTFCAFALASSDLPFLVRDAVLDFRFRNLPAVRGDTNIQFYCGFPILSPTGITIASLCIVDTKPRTQVTTMQYAIIKRLTTMISKIWEDKYAVAI